MNRPLQFPCAWLCIASALVFSFPRQAQSAGCVPAPAGLAGWWKAEGNALDSAGTNDGILENVTFTAGKVGPAFHLNGTNADVQIPYSTSLEPTNVSVEAWVNLDALDSPVASAPGLQYIVFKKNSRDGNFEGYDLEKNRINGQDVFRFQVTSAAGQQIPAASVTGPQPGVWYHLVGTYDGTTVRIYVNGALEGTATAGFPLDYGTRPVFIGTTGEWWDGRFEGAVDEVSIYSRTLSPDEIATLYGAGSAGKCAPTNVPPFIITQPTDQTAVLGGTATFSVLAGGVPPPTYQWFSGSGILPGQTGSTLVLTNVQLFQAGNYYVVVSNLLGSVTSSNAHLTVLTFPPAITNQPKSLTVYQGSDATLTVQATGTAPLSYQWYFEGAPVGDGLSSAGPTATLTLTNVQPSQQGNYWVTVSNAYGFVISSNALLTVLPPPVCVPPPAGIVAWWRAESNTVDSVGINDLLFSRGQSAFSSALISFTQGKVGGAFVFNSGFQESYLSALPTEALNVGPGAGLTIESWIRPGWVAPAVAPLVEWNDGHGNVGAGLMLSNRPTRGVLVARLADITSPVVRIVEFHSPALAITNEGWQHVALTYDHTDGWAMLYVNGTVVAQTNLGAFTPLTQTPVYLGGSPSGSFAGARFEPGGVDELSLYNRALRADEIQSIVRADYAGKCVPPPPVCVAASPGIVGWWRGQSNTLDCVNGNNGIVSNSISYTNGEVGACFRFTNGWIRVPAASNLNLSAGPGFSIELWANPQILGFAVSYAMLPMVGWVGATNNLAGLDFSIARTSASPVSTLLRATLVDTQGISHIARAPTGLGSAGGWQHVAVTYDKATGMAVLYYNGHPITQTNLGIFTIRSGGDLYFGRQAAPLVGAPSPILFQGMLDEIGIYNRVLSPDEIAAIVAARGAGQCAEPPVIITQPQSQMVNLGDTAVFSVTAEGTPVLHYQWFLDGSAINGATDPILTLTGAQTNQSGIYSVTASNMLGVAVSSNAVLRVNRPPIADASATAPLAISCNNSNATVILDGARSSDSDGDTLRFAWFITGSNSALATGMVAEVVLPPGTNSITLQVSDGCATSEQTISVEVITTAQAVQRLIDRVDATVDKPQPLTAILNTALNALSHDHCVSAIAELRAFQVVVRAQVSGHNQALAASLSAAAETIIQAIESCCEGHGHEHVFPTIHCGHGRVHLEFAATPGRSYLVEASDDLVHWEKVGVATDLNDGNFEFDDSHSLQQPTRFYRIVPPQ